MTRRKEYHPDVCAKMHENFVRYDCYKLAQKRYPYKDVDDIIEQAKKTERYVLDEPPCTVVYLKT